MAYESGAATNTADLFDRLVDMLTNSGNANYAGWTLHDTLTASNDVVITSDGVDGDSNLVIRLSRDSDEFHKSPNSLEAAYDWIFVRGYQHWDAAGDTGTKEFGKWGPWVGVFNTSGVNPGAFMLAKEGSEGQPPFLPWWDTLYTFSNRNFAPFFWDGHRIVYFRSVSDNLKVWDMGRPTDEVSEIYDGVTEPQLGDYKGFPALVHDKTNDRDFIYNQGTAGQNAEWGRIDIEAKTTEVLAAPPFGGQAESGWAVWDGSNTIYAHRGNSGTEFAKYSISGDSWTSLTASTEVMSASIAEFAHKVLYIPSSVGLQDTGASATDVILTLGGNSFGAPTKIHSYEVSTDTWGNNDIAFPGALSDDTEIRIEWDGNKFLYIIEQNNNPVIYRYDLTTGTGLSTDWTSLGSLQVAGGGFTSEWMLQYFDPAPCKIKGNDAMPITYQFIADKDHVIVVTELGGNEYWAYFGTLKPVSSKGTMTTTSAVSAGTPATIAVDDSSNYSAGDVILLMDPDNGTVEKASIFSVPDGTSIKANITNSYATGTLIGEDPSPVILTGDSYLAVANLDADGYESDGQAANYRIHPSAAPVGEKSPHFKSTNPSVRRKYIPLPMMVYNNQSGMKTEELRGTLRGVFAVEREAFPGVQQGDTISIDGNQYKAVRPYISRDLADNRIILVGPIN